MSWYLEALKKYAVFSGRARRREYWFFTLFNVIVIILATIIDMMIADSGRRLGMPIALVYVAATLVPSLAVGARRLHDTDRSAWWLLLSLVPFGALVLIVFYIQDGTPGPNTYGENPKTAATL